MIMGTWFLRGAAAWLLIQSASAGPSDARKLIAEGNAHFEAGRYSEAREVYANTPEPTEPALVADLLHNRAAAEFKLGNYAAARDLWVRAAGLLDATFEAKANYNLGNCSYREALDALETQQSPAAADATGAAPPASVPTEQILSLLGRSIERYRDAIRLDPTLIDARANMELADQLRKKIKEQATSQPQSQPQSQPGSQPSDQQQGEGDQHSQSQPSSNPSKSDKPQSQPSEGDQQQENQDGQQDEQKQPESKPSQSQPASQPQPQPQPESQPQSQPSEGGEEKEMQMSPSEFERLLQKVRDAERLRRQRLREAERSRQRPVDKDW